MKGVSVSEPRADSALAEESTMGNDHSLFPLYVGGAIAIALIMFILASTGNLSWELVNVILE